MQKNFLLLLSATILFNATFSGVLGNDDDLTDTELIDEFLNGGQSPDTPKPNSPNKSPEDESPALPLQGPKQEVGGQKIPIKQSSSEDEQTSDEILKESKPCECVKYYLCNIDNGTVVDNGDVLGLIDIRLGASKPSACPHYFDICCPDLKQTPQESKQPATMKKFEHSVCGKRNVGGVGFRITGAENMEAQFGEFPWMAAIVKQEQEGDKPPLNIYLCGGSLIHPQVVLTTAHWVFGKPPEELKVRLGEWDTITPHELYPHQDRLVSKIVIHEGYYPGALFNDIALIFLKEPVKFAPNIDTVCLPPLNMNFDGQTCYASGWGKNSFGQDGKYQAILKKIELPVVPVDKCQSALRKTRLGPHFKLHDSFVCAGSEEGRDTCRGDGGSPLVCQLPDSPYYVLYGLVSWGIGCGAHGTPGVYVNVPKFVPWITEKMQEAKMDTSFFKVSS